MITLNARKDFELFANAAGTSIEKMPKDAADNANATGESALADIEHDERVIEDAKLRIKRSQVTLKWATGVLKAVKRYVA